MTIETFQIIQSVADYDSPEVLWIAVLALCGGILLVIFAESKYNLRTSAFYAVLFVIGCVAVALYVYDVVHPDTPNPMCGYTLQSKDQPQKLEIIHTVMQRKNKESRTCSEVGTTIVKVIDGGNTHYLREFEPLKTP